MTNGSYGSVSLLPLALPKRPSSRAFTIQYTTLILIIITFIVGAFGGRPADKGAESPREAVPYAKGDTLPALAAPEPTVEGREPSDSIKIERLFKAASVELDGAKAEAIAQVLRAHDIDAEIDVVADSMGEDDYRIALRQARALQRYLLNAQVPPAAFRVFVVDSKIPAWAAGEMASFTSVRFYRGGSDER